jgi:hypothetical protein
MDILSPEPRSRTPAHRRMPAVLIATLLAATGAAAQERAPAGAVTYSLGSTTLPAQGEALGNSRVEMVRWASTGNGAWGMSLGTSHDGRTPMRPEVGVRWRSRLEGNQHLDLSAWRQLSGANGAAADPDEAVLHTRIELQFTAPRRTASFGESGALGLQLGSDAKLSMRMRRGGPMVYYRMQF